MYRSDEGTKSFEIDACVLFRWKIVADVKTIAREQGLSIVSERDGWTTRFDITGPAPDVDRFVQAVHAVQGNQQGTAALARLRLMLAD